MDMIKLRDQLEDALQSALNTSNVGQRIGEDDDVLAVALMQEVWDHFEPDLMDGIVSLQKPAPGAGFEDWARDYCRRVHGVEVNLTTCDDTYLFALPRDLYAAWVASVDAGAPSDADLIDAEKDIDDAQRYRWLQALTDEYIDRLAESMPGGMDGFMKGWGWRQFARALLRSVPKGTTGDPDAE